LRARKLEGERNFQDWLRRKEEAKAREQEALQDFMVSGEGFICTG
jgi:hypothetical protein